MKGGYIPIPDELAERTDLSAGHKLLLGIIARIQGDKASCFPGYDYLVKASGISRRQVIRIVNDLAVRKELIRVRFPYQSNSYAVPWATARALRKKHAIEHAERRRGAA